MGYGIVVLEPAIHYYFSFLLYHIQRFSFACSESFVEAMCSSWVGLVGQWDATVAAY